MESDRFLTTVLFSTSTVKFFILNVIFIMFRSRESKHRFCLTLFLSRRPLYSSWRASGRWRLTRRIFADYRHTTTAPLPVFAGGRHATTAPLPVFAGGAKPCTGPSAWLGIRWRLT